ncbi:MAG: methyltransferase [Gammaproteobacteria bacterium]|nr:methyltransferase [Gammaproteobacteria bacterium]
MKQLTALAFSLLLVACGQDAAPPAPAEPASDPPAQMAEVRSLSEILAAQPAEVQARYQYRHPGETLEFFGVSPGSTVIEALPGGGWYSKILLPYLGPEGKLIGANYAIDMWPRFGFFSDEFIEGTKTWVTDWPAGAEEWRDEDSASVSAFVLGSMPDELAGNVDTVLFIRALHNMQRFEADGGYLTSALMDAYTALKPGGVMGVVQHRAPEDMPDEWADGSAGYLKQSFVVAQAEKAGFELVDESEINANPNDQPTTEDVVWRLPPSLQNARDNEELRAAMEAIGESDRMTLKFRKPM